MDPKEDVVRVYPSEDNWPETPREAHKMLLNAINYLWAIERVEFETMPERIMLNDAQIELCGEIIGKAAAS